MKVNLPEKVRLGIYVIVVLVSAVIVPLHAFGYVADVVMAVWVSLSAAASGLAAFNVPR